jgi:hypothetical protein
VSEQGKDLEPRRSTLPLGFRAGRSHLCGDRKSRQRPCVSPSHQEEDGALKPCSAVGCSIAITRTGEIWKRASIIASSFFSHSESTICSSINYSVGAGDPPFVVVPILVSASDRPRARRPSLVSKTSTIFNVGAGFCSGMEEKYVSTYLEEQGRC